MFGVKPRNSIGSSQSAKLIVVVQGFNTNLIFFGIMCGKTKQENFR